MLEKAVKYAKELCDSGGHKLLYLIKYGSHLYGTNTPESDLDVVGIYAPSFESLVTLNAPKTLHYSSGDEFSKNNKDDIDIKLYSIQYFILNKIKSMDINALDLFFSIDSPNVHIYKDSIIDELYDNRIKVLSAYDIADMSYLEYARNQVKKYGLKGTKVWVYLKIFNYLEDFAILGNDLKSMKLMDIYEDLLVIIEDESLVAIEQAGPILIEFTLEKETVSRKFLRVIDQYHDLGITVKEFYKRIKAKDSQFGERARLAMLNDGVDWKACSHALRAIYQMKEFYATGKMSFPVSNTDVLISVKQGELAWSEVEIMIEEGLAEVSGMKLDDTLSNFNWDCNYINQFICKIYKDSLCQKQN